MLKKYSKSAAVLFFSVLGLSACQPSLNWRTVQMPGTTLSFELPCKPDQTTKPVTMAGQNLELSVMGCEAGDAVWAVMSAKLSADAAEPARALLRHLTSAEAVKLYQENGIDPVTP